MKFSNCGLLCLTFLIMILVVAPLQADLILNENFDAGSTPPDQHRVYDARLDTGWNATFGYGGNNIPSAWDIAGGQLFNPTASAPTGSGYTESESPVWNWWTNPDGSNNTHIDVCFDYDVGAGDTLHFHFWGVQAGGAAGSNTYITNPQAWQNGNSGQNQVTSAGGYTPYNLLDGSNQPTNGSITGALSGAGTYVGSIDIASLGIAGVTTAGDFDTFFIGFSMNEVGGGTTSVDNLKINSSVPEPSSMAVLGLIYCSITTRRRRR